MNPPPVNSEWLITELLDEKSNAKYTWQYYQRGQTKDWVLAIDLGTGTNKILNVSESQLDVIPLPRQFGRQLH